MNLPHTDSKTFDKNLNKNQEARNSRLSHRWQAFLFGVTKPMPNENRNAKRRQHVCLLIRFTTVGGKWQGLTDTWPHLILMFLLITRLPRGSRRLHAFTRHVIPLTLSSSWCVQNDHQRWLLFFLFFCFLIRLFYWSNFTLRKID